MTLPSELDEIRRMFEQHEERDDERFQAVQQTQAEIKIKLDSVGELVSELEQEIGGAPRVGIRRGRPTMRERIHKLENDRAAALAARAALDAATAVKRESWSHVQKTILFAIAIVGAATSVLSLILH